MQHGWMSAPPPSLLLPPLLRLFKPSGETEDTFFADLDVGLSTGQLLPVTQSVVPSTLLQPGKLPNPGPQRYFMASAETQWLLQQSVKPGPSVEQRS